MKAPLVCSQLEDVWNLYGITFRMRVSQCIVSLFGITTQTEINACTMRLSLFTYLLTKGESGKDCCGTSACGAELPSLLLS